MAFPGTSLGRVSFAQNYIDNGQSVTFGSSVTLAGTTVVNGREVTVVVVGLSWMTAGSSWSLNTQTGGGTTRWYPSAAVEDEYGQPADTGVASETGAWDADL
jgi:hypothetical protein